HEKRSAGTPSNVIRHWRHRRHRAHPPASNHQHLHHNCLHNLLPPSTSPYPNLNHHLHRHNLNNYLLRHNQHQHRHHRPTRPPHQRQPQRRH
ncbi:hypothetical protein LTS18_010065, partial [Coniosporium uncinatum]